MRNLLLPATRVDDPGEAWAEALLSDLRRETLEIDVTRQVMRRIEVLRAAPAARPLPGRWPGVAWAASLALGCLSLVLLMATLGAMMLAGDEGARASWALITSAGQVTWGLFGHVWVVAAAFVSASLAMARGAFTVIDSLAPLVRGAGALAAVAGALSIACSAYVFDRARRGAPIAIPRDPDPIRGGLS